MMASRICVEREGGTLAHEKSLDLHSLGGDYDKDGSAVLNRVWLNDRRRKRFLIYGCLSLQVGRGRACISFRTTRVVDHVPEWSGIGRATGMEYPGKGEPCYRYTWSCGLGPDAYIAGARVVRIGCKGHNKSESKKLRQKVRQGSHRRQWIVCRM
ncbi:hypothetical protein AG1IA_03970 [Rhizoctonia solani AG-1 IA]|uniref:Uncharacterized protein n=1 Tax=Thanatephorus cucumeris (strain AG1-IA) TaxID=983506 RepID=L8WYV4_THACA|nr:hypothetical protein AG1IA_03970 [Rhizoctonia solani AG-1 IA]